MLKKYNKKTKGALLFRHIHPQWHRNSIVKEGLYNNEYLKVEISKNAHYNVEMYYNATGKEQKGFFKVWKHASRTFGLFDLEGKMLNYGYFDKSPKPKYIQLYPKVKSNSSQSRISEVFAFCWSCGSCCTECIIIPYNSGNSGGGGYGYMSEMNNPTEDSPYDPGPVDEGYDNSGLGSNGTSGGSVSVGTTPPPPPPFVDPPEEEKLPEPVQCDSPSPANRLNDVNNMPPEKTSNTQINPNTCVLKTLEYVSKYFGSDLKEGDFLLYEIKKNQNYDVYNYGLNPDEINDLLNYFTTFSNILPQDVNNAIINKDHPVMAFYETGIDPTTNKPFGHEVMITGVSDDGKYFRYFDPQLGEYRCLPKEDLEDFREIKGFK